VLPVPLIPAQSLLKHAQTHRYGIGYFEAWDSYSLEAVVEAAEIEQSPVFIGFGCMMLDRAWLEESGVEILGCIGLKVARRTRVPVALLLNETQTFEQAVRGLRAGFNMVMMDTSGMPSTASVKSVAELVRIARQYGAAVEAELGHLPDALPDGSIDASRSMLTDPEQAAHFVAATGVDSLGVSIGNVHLLRDRDAPIDLGRLEAISHRVEIPLVIHGGTSFPAQLVRKSILRGAVKFNVGTILKAEFLNGMRQALTQLTPDFDLHAVIGSHKETDIMHTGKARMRDRIRELMALYGSSGQAEAASAFNMTIKG
jgi:ketose-bisphosphate aldolase